MKARFDGGELRAPAVGLWRDAPAKGSLVTPGASLGRLEVLGVLHDLTAPDGAYGIVVALGGDDTRARRPVDYDALLAVIDRDAIGAPVEASAAEAVDAAMVFRTATSGRFYARPSPDRPPFVSAGDTVSEGQPIAMLEVMKTFTRVPYEGADARVVRVVPSDGDDLEHGDVILELEPA